MIAINCHLYLEERLQECCNGNFSYSGPLARNSHSSASPSVHLNVMQIYIYIYMFDIKGCLCCFLSILLKTRQGNSNNHERVIIVLTMVTEERLRLNEL